MMFYYDEGEMKQKWGRKNTNFIQNKNLIYSVGTFSYFSVFKSNCFMSYDFLKMKIIKNTVSSFKSLPSNEKQTAVFLINNANVRTCGTQCAGRNEKVDQTLYFLFLFSYIVDAKTLSVFKRRRRERESWPKGTPLAHIVYSRQDRKKEVQAKGKRGTYIRL